MCPSARGASAAHAVPATEKTKAASAASSRIDAEATTTYDSRREGFHARRRRHERDQQDLRRHRRHGRAPRAGDHPARHGQGSRAPNAQWQARDHRGRGNTDRRVAAGAARPDPSRAVGVRVAAAQRLAFLPRLAVVFFNVSGGPDGIEDAVSVFGPGLTLLLLVLTPLLVSVPVALAMAEMGSAIPEEGGYVAWVRRAFGPFWSFQVGWWSWLNSFVDVAVYPALFADYLRYWRPEMTAVERWLLALGFVWLLTVVNLSGVRVTGWGAVALSAGALAPIVVLTGVAVARAHVVPWSPFAAPGQGLASGLGLGIAVMMWNYSG